MIDCDSLESSVNYWESWIQWKVFRFNLYNVLVNLHQFNDVRPNGNHKIIITKIIILFIQQVYENGVASGVWESLKYKMIAYNIAVQKFWAVVVLLKFDWD